MNTPLRQCHSLFVSIPLGPAWAKFPLSKPTRAPARKRGKKTSPAPAFEPRSQRGERLPFAVAPNARSFTRGFCVDGSFHIPHRPFTGGAKNGSGFQKRGGVSKAAPDLTRSNNDSFNEDAGATQTELPSAVYPPAVFARNVRLEPEGAAQRAQSQGVGPEGEETALQVNRMRKRTPPVLPGGKLSPALPVFRRQVRH